LKLLFPALCWAIPALGVFIACSKKPLPTPGPAPVILAMDAGKESTMLNPDEPFIELEAPEWTIFFDFDSYHLAEAHKAAALAKYMQETGRRVFLSGHASEEGTTEYNLALGAQRAVSVRRYLEAYGIPDDRIAWQSFGEESPVTSDPEKIHLNRRVEIIIERNPQ
jgi:outer membrane protein OmpA-like peptidoglycan-associated protein